jgi:phenylpropionate dioxygenase-like ring-hydroxylating dioxygenase large terminal subunit
MNTQITTNVQSPSALSDMVVPLARYITPTQFDLEREQIVARSWLLIGHASDIPNPGDYFVRDMEVPKASLLIVRGRDCKIRAFHNVCLHRGNAMIGDGVPGCKSRFTCSFHGWTWSNTGELLGITDEAQFGGLDKSKLGLKTAHCEVWNGQIFVNFSASPRESLIEWLEDLAEGYGDYFESQQKLSSHRFELNANWNLGVNAFTEGYHTLYIHKNTAGDYQGGKSNPQRHRPFMQFMKRHTRYSAPANPDHKLVPSEAIAYEFGRKLLPAACFENETLPAAVNPSRVEHWLFDVIELFPNVVMLCGQHYRIEITFQPISADRTIVTNETFVYRTENLAQRVGQELFRTREREVVREDLSLLEAQHSALSTGAIENIHLSRQEMALAHHFKVRNEMLAIQ